MLEMDEKDLINLSKCGNKEATEELLNRHMNLIKKMARGYIKYGAVFEDLVQEGCIGVIKAINNFDLKQDIKFSTYGVYWIRKIISEYLYNNRLVRLPRYQYLNLRKYVNDKNALTTELGYEPTIKELSQKLGISIAEVSQLENYQIDAMSLNAPLNEKESFEDTLCDEQNVEDIVMDIDKNERLHKIIENCDLKPRDLTILRLRFGLDGNEPVTYTEIGRIFGVTSKAIRLAEKTILRKLRRMREMYHLSIYVEDSEQSYQYTRR